jgi:predicted nucleic-acid-binding protein
MNESAVRWYAEQAMKLEIEKAKGNISTTQMLIQLSDVLEQAKEMEKEQIIKACNDTIQSVELDKDKIGFFAKVGEAYYEQEYKNTKQ